MNKNLSLGDQTDMILHMECGSISQHLDFVSILTPNNPSFFYGNYLLLYKHVSHYEMADLESTYFNEIGNRPGIKHITIGWPYDQQLETPEQYIKLGYDYFKEEILVLKPGCLRAPKKQNTDISIRPFSDDNWEKWLELELSERDNLEMSEKEKASFLRELQANYRRLISKNMGEWYGAFIDRELVGTAGVFYNFGLGRFQAVRTKEKYRNLGICSTLLCEICSKHSNLDKIVIVANTDYFAANVYTKLGFQTFGYQVSICKSS